MRRLATLMGARLATAALVVLASSAAPAMTQQVPARADSTPLRPDYKSVDELLATLPRIAPPAFDETRALWLGALPLGCIDRLQPRVAARGGGGGGGAPGGGGAAVDTAGRGRGAAVPEVAGRGDTVGGRAGGGRGGAPAANPGGGGGGYFWVPTYRLIADHNRNRAFWGCTDWPSATSSTWVAVHILKKFPDLGLKELTREKLVDHLGKSNLAGELAFFRGPAGNFQKPYGYAWLLKLQSELRAFPDSQATRWSGNVAPLAAWMADSLAAYFTGLATPVKTGAQANTALSIDLALDYANGAANVALRRALVSAARKFYLADKNCNTQAEAAAAGAPGRGGGRGAGGGGAGRGAVDSTAARGAGGGVNDLTAAAAAAAARGGGRGGAGGAGANDVLSPCLTEAALMARVLEPSAFVNWVNAFLPPLQSGRFAPLTEAPGAAATGAERTRLSALAFQRAYAMERIAHALPAADPRVGALRRLSAIHADRGFELMRDDVAGTHWVPAYALLYLAVRK